MSATKSTLRAAAILASVAMLGIASPAAAQQVNKNGGVPKPKPTAPVVIDLPPPVPDTPVSPASTPELGSLVLFASGLLGAGGVVLMRARSRRRPDQ